MRQTMVTGDRDEFSERYAMTVFDSLAELVEESYKLCTDSNYLWSIKAWNPSMSIDRNTYQASEWLGRCFGSWQEIRDAALSVWPEGENAIRKMIEEIINGSELPKPMSRRRSRQWSENDGDEIDRDRLWSGQPYFDTRVRQVKTGTANISIVAGISSAAGLSSEQILWRGALATTLTDVLEKAGYRVDLWAADASVNVGIEHDLLVAVPLKKTHDPLNVSAIAGSLSGWYYRTIFFASCFVCDRRSHSVGAMSPVKNSVRRFAGDPCILIENVFDYETAIAEANRIVQELRLTPEAMYA